MRRDRRHGISFVLPAILVLAGVAYYAAAPSQFSGMFLNSDRPGTFGVMDLWVSWRAHTRDDFGWQPPVNLGPYVNTSSSDQGASFIENDETGIPVLLFTSDRPGGAGALDIYLSALAADGSFGPATSVAELNTPQAD